MSQSNFTEARYAEVPGEAIKEMIWGRLMPAVEGTPVDHAILGMLAYSILLMKSDVDYPTMQAAIKAATEAIVLTIVPPQGAVN